MADEIGIKEKTPHTHIFACFCSRVRFSTVQKHFPQAHIETVKGTVGDNINYVKKSGKWENDMKHGTKIDGSFEEFGNRPPDSKGKRDDMSELYRMVSDGMTNAEILAENQDYILQIEKIDKVRTTILTERYKNTVRTDLEVIYVYGATGTGKTSSILKEYGCENVYRVTDYEHPFDGYQCQPVIAFDEFRSSLRLKEMLNYCDIYPLELPARYSNKFACYSKVYIVSNWCLERQYPDLQTTDNESWTAFLRRIHKVQVFMNEKIVTYNSVTEYVERNEAFHPMAETDQRQNPFTQIKLNPKAGGNHE